MTFTATALMCLAMNLYHEGRGLPIVEQYAIALVTMNRAGQDNQKVCKVVMAPYQFSWTNNGGATWEGKNIRLAKYLTPLELSAWDTSLKISKAVLDGRMFDITTGSTHYHLKTVKPVWAKKLQPTRNFGPHVFYRKDKSQLTIIAKSSQVSKQPTH